MQPPTPTEIARTPRLTPSQITPDPASAIARTLANQIPGTELDQILGVARHQILGAVRDRITGATLDQPVPCLLPPCQVCDRCLPDNPPSPHPYAKSRAFVPKPQPTATGRYRAPPLPLNRRTLTTLCSVASLILMDPWFGVVHRNAIPPSTVLIVVAKDRKVGGTLCVVGGKLVSSMNGEYAMGSHAVFLNNLQARSQASYRWHSLFASTTRRFRINHIYLLQTSSRAGDGGGRYVDLLVLYCFRFVYQSFLASSHDWSPHHITNTSRSTMDSDSVSDDHAQCAQSENDKIQDPTRTCHHRSLQLSSQIVS